MEAFGMQVVLIPPQTEKQILDQLLERVNGVLLTGGDANVHPRFYDQTPIPGQSFDVARTQTAIYLARECANRGIPALGVCLGSQEMNVALGGKLQQSVDGHDHGYVNPHSRDDIAHDIRVMDGGMLSEIFGAQAAHGVTSVHRQGYYKDDLAPGLRVEALDDASPLVEAFSKSGHPFFMGVQFHVEFHPRDPKNFAIFSRFTQEAVAHFRKLADDKKGVCELPGLKPIINAC